MRKIIENKKNKRVQICFDVDEDLHRFIKSNAALRGISITYWITVMLRREIENLKKYE